MVYQLLAAGIVSGAIYALVGLGLIVTFKATDVISFAQGMMVVLGAYLGVTASGTLGLNYGAAFVIAILGVACVGWLADRLVYRPLLNAPHMVQVLATLAVANVIQGAVVLIWGTSSHAFPPSARMNPVVTSPVVMTGQQILIVLCAFAAMGLLTAFFGLTWWGKAVRAASQNRIGASLSGIRISRVFSLAGVIAAMLGGLAGVLYGPMTLVDPSLDWLLVKGFAAAALGGLTSLPGAVLGGLLLGLLESLWSAALPAVWAPVLSYVLITIVLVAKPSGLLGGSVMRKL